MARAHGVGVVCIGIVLMGAARAHETLFGISPATVYKHGWQVEFHAEEAHAAAGGGRREREREADLSAFYGVEPHISLGFGVPWRSVSERDGGRAESASGTGDLTLFGKYRFYKEDVFLGTTYASLIAAYTYAGAPRTSDPPLSDGADALLVGIGVSRVGKHWAVWWDAGARFFEEANGAREAPERIANLAVGWRPRVAELDEIDFQVLLEFNHEAQGRARTSAGEVTDSGGSTWFVSPGVRTGKGTYLVSLGVQIPVAQERHGDQVETDYRIKIGWEGVF